MYPFECRVPCLIKILTAFTGWRVSLFTAPSTIDEESEFADFTIPTFSGSTPIVVPWGDPILDDEDIAMVQWTTPVTFTVDFSGAPDVCLGAFIYADFGGGANKLFDAKLFSAPIVMENVGNNVTIPNWVYRLGQLLDP